MARTKKSVKSALDKAPEKTITFTVAELEKKIQTFLEENDACDKEWLNKAKREFLGQKTFTVDLEVRVKAGYSVTVTADNKEDAVVKASVEIKKLQEDGDFEGWNFEDDSFVVVGSKATGNEE